MKLREKILNNTQLKHTSLLSESEIFEGWTFLPTIVPMINVALSGRVDGGISAGLTEIAGNSKHFKTGFALLLASTYLNHDPEAVILFYDSEFGSPENYIERFGIDKERIIHSPVTDMEQLKHDLMFQLESKEGIQRGDKVMIIVDSLGNLASKKEIDDALEGKSVADMTRAKSMKGLFRMVRPHLILKNLPMIAINHVYKEIGTMYPKDIVSGGTGHYYNSDNIWIVGRQQEKEDKAVIGYNFIINIEKSRYVREKSKIPIFVGMDDFIDKYSGLLELALAGGYLETEKRSYLSKHIPDTKISFQEFEKKRGEIFDYLLAKTDFPEYIRKTYALPTETIEKE